MPGSKSRRPPPSYVDGKLRDPRIEKLQDPRYSADDLKKTIRKVVRKKQPKNS